MLALFCDFVHQDEFPSPASLFLPFKYIHVWFLQSAAATLHGGAAELQRRGVAAGAYSAKWSSYFMSQRERNTNRTRVYFADARLLPRGKVVENAFLGA